MSEKVLGFYAVGGKAGKKKVIVNKPVRLASESVDLKTLKEFCKKNYLPYNQDICNLIEWAEKEAKKKN